MRVFTILMRTVILGTIVVVAADLNANVIAFKPSTKESSGANAIETTVPPIDRVQGNHSATQGETTQPANQISSSVPLYYPNGSRIDFPPITDLSPESVLVQLSNGTQLQVPKTITFENGTTVDALPCIKAMTPDWMYMPPYCHEAGFSQ